MKKELEERIKKECSFSDIQKILNIIEKEKTIFTFWNWSDIEKIVISQYPKLHITKEIEENIMLRLDGLENFPAMSEDIVNALSDMEFIQQED